MARFDVPGSIRGWELGELGELHEVARPGGSCELWLTRFERCRSPIRYVWAQQGKGDRCYCAKHGIDTFPEARNKPDFGRPLP